MSILSGLGMVLAVALALGVIIVLLWAFNKLFKQSQFSLRVKINHTVGYSVLVAGLAAALLFGAYVAHLVYVGAIKDIPWYFAGFRAGFIGCVLAVIFGGVAIIAGIGISEEW